MALNKSMHPRNRYKDKPPDFAYLASKYPEFKQHVNVNLAGRVSLNFKDPCAVRALTCTLLREDFGLTIDIPLERLIPTVPLRLNYIHWVEDLINYHDSDKTALRRGIDIVVKVPQKTLLMDALKEESEIIYDFCMCNPPFFANQLEAQGVNSRNPHRPPPSSVNTGGITEIMAEGGELEFVKRIIHDSLKLKKRLRWYSCMLGKKCSLAPLKEELRKQGVPRVAHTEFYQGRTMRWALAWSFYEEVIIPNPPKKRKLEKPRKPMVFTVLESVIKLLVEKLPSGSEVPESITVVTDCIKKILTDLKVQHKDVPCGRGEESLFLTAVENSWIHIRRKRRDRTRQLRELPRAPDDFLQSNKPESALHKESPKQGLNSGDPAAAQESESITQSETCVPHTSSSPASTTLSHSEPMEDEGESSKPDEVHNIDEEEQDLAENMNQSSGEVSLAPQGRGLPFLFKCILNVKKENSDVLVEMHCVEGQNRDLMNQLCTYLRNQICRLATS
uniref:U6 small nuclear RNA (adenine-(43)-N(6))-methyltransferase n=1 Tax=Xenopus tropicalis TaxID=8364 RepID=A0A6I8RZL8_XENTR